MKRIADGVINHRKGVLILFLILVLLGGFLATQVQINYELSDYLPENVPSSVALEKVKEEFNFTIPNARVAFPVSSIQEALQYKEKLNSLDVINEVLWLDDSVDISSPVELQKPAVVDSFYKDGYALFQVNADTNHAAEVLEQIRSLNSECKVDGQLVSLASAQKAVKSEILSITLIIIPFVLLILLFTTHSWLEPFVFMLTIVVGIILNMGTNALIGKISFISQSVASVLQLAVSMDYAIFLLNRFNENRKDGMDPEEAMSKAVQRSSVAISSSASTTFFGFLVLIFMRFQIGGNLGIVMAKGILFSYFSVLFFMPALVMATYKWIDKTTHKAFIPEIDKIGKFALRHRRAILIIVLLTVIPSFLGSRNNSFIYGMGAYPVQSKEKSDEDFIQEHFGMQEQLSLLVPTGRITKEIQLQSQLENMPNVKAVSSYVSMVDPVIPREMVDKEKTALLSSDNYSQFIITAAIHPEGDIAFDLVDQVRTAATDLYGEHIYLTGHPVIMEDMKTTIRSDDAVVNGFAILAIAVVIMLAFKSLILPIVLVSTIEIAIWMNLSIPYFSGESLSYIGYLIISTVQLGATVDYAILYTEHYLDCRKTMNKHHSTLTAAKETLPSLFPPALILTFAGFALERTSSLGIVSELGQVLGRGAIFSFLMVVLALPGLLHLLDSWIEKLSWRLNFYRPGKLRRSLKAEENSKTSENAEIFYASESFKTSKGVENFNANEENNKNTTEIGSTIENESTNKIGSTIKNANETEETIENENTNEAELTIENKNTNENEEAETGKNLNNNKGECNEEKNK